MSPRRVTLTRDRVLEAACSLVGERGLSALSARAVAETLGASVAPIYSAYGSMEELQAAVLEAAYARLREYTGREYTNMPFRSAGVGLVMFARDEPQLYHALFLERHARGQLVTRMLEHLRETLRESPGFEQLAPAMRDELLMDMWIYTHGLASMVVAGLMPRPEAEAVDRKLNRVGAIVIGAAITTTLGPVDLFHAGRSADTERPGHTEKKANKKGRQ